MATAGAQVRLVRCPKCLNVLPEPGGVLMYLCGGCGAVLRAKNPQVAHAGSRNSDNSPQEKGESSGIAEVGEPSSAVAGDGEVRVSETTELLATAKSSEKGSSEAKTDYSFDQQEARSLQVGEQHSDNSTSPESVTQSNDSEGRPGPARRGRRSGHLRSSAAVSSSDDGTQTCLHDELKAPPAASRSVTSEEEMLDRSHGGATQRINLRSSTASSSDGGSRKFHQMSRRTNRKGSSEANSEYSFKQQEEEEKSLNAQEQDSDKASPESLSQSNGSEQGFGLAQNYLHDELKAPPALSQSVASEEEEMLEKTRGATQSNNLRSSTASSSDDGSLKYRQMSRRTIRDQRFSGSVSTKSGEGGGGENLSRNSSVNANAQRRGSLNSEAFFSVQSWVESEEEGPSRSRSSVSSFSEHPPRFQNESAKLKNLKLLKLVEELRDQLTEKRPRSRLGRSSQETSFLDDDDDYQQYRASQMPVSYLHCHLEPNSCCNNRHCAACSYNSCCHSSKPRRSVQRPPKARAARSYCRPVSGGAPFVVCSNCFEVLRVPADFLVSTRSNKLKCGACSVVMVLLLPARAHRAASRASDEAAGRASEGPVSLPADYGASFADGSSVAEEAELPALNVSRASSGSGSGSGSGRPGASSAALHQLMGYGSARLLLF